MDGEIYSSGNLQWWLFAGSTGLGLLMVVLVLTTGGIAGLIGATVVGSFFLAELVYASSTVRVADGELRVRNGLRTHVVPVDVVVAVGLSRSNWTYSTVSAFTDRWRHVGISALTVFPIFPFVPATSRQDDATIRLVTALFDVPESGVRKDLIRGVTRFERPIR